MSGNEHMIRISKRAAEQHQTIARHLAATGLAIAIIAQPDANCPLVIDESEAARAGDVILSLGASSGLVRNASPHITYLGEDSGLAAMLALACIRGADQPAIGDPISAALADHLATLAASNISVLIEGESGTGKEGVARLIHAQSSRRDGPFIPVNCAALPATMIEAMLFGHMRGAFTGAQCDQPGLIAASDGGTLFLDEIGELPLEAQAKLLRVLQDGEVMAVGAVHPRRIDIRIVTATNRNLAQDVLAGRFRADLYWRLNVVPVTLCPLRERPGDITAIAAHLLIRHTPPGQPVRYIASESIDAMRAHPWPGNARELENLIQRALVLDRNPSLIIEPDAFATHGDTTATSLADHMRAAEARAIRAVLGEVDGHRRRAASRLGISERTLRSRIADMRRATMPAL
jgi:two-component system, response regulator FlrC